MVYAYNSKIYLAEAVLNVKDLAGQVAFYTQIIGLEIQTQTEREVILGAGNKPLVHSSCRSVIPTWPTTPFSLSSTKAGKVSFTT